MKNLMKKIRKSNKGFTLVELIIVVAIIAILSAVIAPQYIKYVEKSRQGTDANAAQEIAHACEVAFVGNGLTASTGGSLSVAISDTSGTEGAATYSGSLETAVASVIPEGQYTFKSDFYRGKTLTFDVSATGVCTWGVAASGGGYTAPSHTQPIE